MSEECGALVGKDSRLETEKCAMKTLALIHTVHPVIPEIESLCRRLLPDVRTAHFLDETILRDLNARGRMDAEIASRVAGLVVRAEKGGADAALMTCSSIGGCITAARELVSIPVHRIDAPMAAAAVRRSSGRIGVTATVNSTLQPTAQLIRDVAKQRGKRVRIITALFAEAFGARMGGDSELHDRILEQGILELARRCKTIVLAQASMARVTAGLTLPKGAKVLSSPETGVAQMKRVLK